MAFSLGPYKIQLPDKLRSGFRVKYNLLLDKVIKDGEGYEKGIKLITHDGSELEIDITDFFYSKEILDEAFFIDYATEEEAGKIRIATMEEVLDGEDDLTVVTPYKLWQLLLTLNGRAVIAGEDLMPGDMVYLYFPETEEPVEPVDPDDPEAESLFPVLTANKALATKRLTVAMGFVEYEALAGEETFIRFSGNVSTFHQMLTPGTYYYLSAEDPGLITNIPPKDAGSYIQIVGYAVSDVELMLEIHRPDLNWGPVFNKKFPPLYYTAGIESSASLLLTKYIEDYNLNIPELDPENPDVLPEVTTQGFTYRFLALPSWVTTKSVVFDNMTIGGLPTVPGVYTPFLEVIDEGGRRYLHELQLIVLPPTKYYYELVETSSGEDVEIGPIPGSYPLPDQWNELVRVVGPHDWIQITTKGGGPTGDAIDVTESYPLTDVVEEGSYRLFADSIGQTTPAGLYRTWVTISISDNITSRNNTTFILYDEEFLNLVKFYLVAGGAEIDQIDPAGRSIFEAVGPANIKAVIDGVPHDKADMRLTYRTEDPIQERSFPLLTTPVSDAEYLVYSGDEDIPPGDYTIWIDLRLTGNLVFSIYADFKITKKKPEVTGGLLKLVQQQLPGRDFRFLGVIPQTGGTFDLPANFSVLSDSESAPYDWEGFIYEQIRGDKIVPIDVEKYTKSPQWRQYAYSVSQSDYYIFGDLNSLAINAIHQDGSANRVTVTRKLGGPAGDVVAIIQGEFTFAEEPVDFEDKEEGEPGGGLYDYVGRVAIGEEVIDYIKYFDALFDNSTIGVNDDNELEVLANGIKYIHFQQVPAKTLLGNKKDATGNIESIRIVDVMEQAELDDMITALSIKNYFNQQLEANISGMTNYVSKFTATSKLGVSQIFDNGTNIGIGTASPTSKLFVIGDVRASEKLISNQQRFNTNDGDKISLYSDRLGMNNNLGFSVSGTGTILNYKTNSAHGWMINSGTEYAMYLSNTALSVSRQIKSNVTGVPPFIVSSNLLNVDLHADLLNKRVIAGAGLTGGGLLTADRTLAFDTTFGDARYLKADGTGSIRYVSLNPAIGAASDLADSLDLSTVSRTSVFIAQNPTNGASGSTNGFVFTQAYASSFAQFMMIHSVQDAFYYRRKTAGISYAWEQVASRSHVAATYVPLIRQIIAGDGLTGGGDLSANRTLTLGTPGTLNGTSVNAVTSVSHTHEIATGNLVQGANIVLTGTLTNRLVGLGNVTIAATAIPWSIVISRPTTIDGYGITDAVKVDSFNTALNGKENTFAKGNLVQSSGILLQGTLTNRLVGTGDVTVGLQWSGVSAGTYRSVQVDLFGRVVDGSNPTTVAGYGLTDVYTKTEVNSLLSGKENTFSKGNLVQSAGILLQGTLTSRLVGAGDVTISLQWTGVSAGTYKSVQVDLYGRVVDGSNPTTLAGFGITNAYTKAEVDALISSGPGVSGTTGYFPIFTSSSSIGNSVMRDINGEINIPSSRSFGVEGAAAMRSYLHVHDYVGIGKSGQHGSLVIHSANAATAHASAALDIQSTTKGFKASVMTQSQRLAISSPAVGLMVYQSDAGTNGAGPYWHQGGGTWIKFTPVIA